MASTILFVDSNVTDYNTLLTGLGNEVEVCVLNKQEDGVLQIASVLKSRANLDSVHILSHGSSGLLSLGSSVLNTANLARYSDALKTIGSSLSANGDILLYGCDVAQGQQGRDFISRLSAITDADVAASSDLTGNAALGGDWQLETTIGNIEEESLQAPSYSNTLPSNQSSTLSFSANQLSIWGAAGWTAEHLYGINTEPKAYSPYSLGAGVTLEGELTKAEFGLKASVGVSAGSFDLTYPVQYSINTPNNTQPGNNVLIDTAFDTVASPSLTVRGPTLDVSLKAVAKMEGKVALTNGTNSLENAVALGGEATLFNIAQLSSLSGEKPDGLVKMEWNIANALNLNTTKNFGYNVGLEKDLEVTATPDNPMLKLSADVDDFLGISLPAFTAIDGKVPFLGSDIEWGVGSVDLIAQMSPYLKATLKVDNVLTTLTASTGEQHSGNLGDDFYFNVPSTYADSSMQFSANYQLVGDVEFEYGLEFKLGIEAKFLFAEYEGVDLGAWKTGAFDVALAKDTYAVNFPWALGSTSVALDAATFTKSGSFSVNTNPDIATDYITPTTPNPVTPKLSVEILDATQSYEGAYSGNTWTIAEGDVNKIVTIRITRSDNLSNVVNADYSFTFGEDVDANDFVNGLPVNGSLIFQSGEDYKDIQLQVKGDTNAEINETLSLSLSSNSSIVSDETTQLVINSDDGLKIYADGLTFGSAGKDIIYGNSLSANNDILAGSNNDTIYINWDDTTTHDDHSTVDGGTGYDILNLNISGGYKIDFSIQSTNGNWLDFKSDSATITELLAAFANVPIQYRYTLPIYQQDSSRSLTWRGIEAINIKGSHYDDILIYQGGTEYTGSYGIDTFFGDFSSWTEAVIWINKGDDVITKLGAVHQIAVSGMERLLLLTGTGDDLIDNRAVNIGKADEINAGAGNDSIYGGVGNDILNGGDGDDTIDAGADDDFVNAGAGNDTILAGGMNSGTDDLNGGTGNDTYVISHGFKHSNISDDGGDNDRIVFTGYSQTSIWFIKDSDDNLLILNHDTDEYLTLIKGLSDNPAYRIESFIFDNGTLTLEQIRNSIPSYPFTNPVTRNSSSETGFSSFGTNANDNYIIFNTADIIVENSNQGLLDSAISYVNYTLPDNVEKIDLWGTEPINGTGNAKNNSLYAHNLAPNILSGLAGDDTYYIYGEDSYKDTIIENINEGIDTVQADISYTLPNNVEWLLLMGSGSINGTGNELSNHIMGNFSPNILSGGAGDDLYFIGNGDTIVEKSNEGRDSVNSNITYILPDNVEDILLTGSGSINGTGNELNNFLSGNVASNSLYGRGGNDQYQFSLGFGNDIVSEEGFGGNDYVHFWSLKQSDIVFNKAKNGNDLLANIISTNETLTIINSLSSDVGYFVEKFIFSDGSVTLDQIKTKLGLYEPAPQPSSPIDPVSTTPVFVASVSVPTVSTPVVDLMPATATPITPPVIVAPTPSVDSTPATPTATTPVTVAPTPSFESAPATDPTPVAATPTVTTPAILIPDAFMPKNFTGTAGNDPFISRSTNETFDGGAGFDTLTYKGKLSNFSFSKTTTGITLKDNTGANGTDTLKNIEKIQFDDVSINLTVKEKAATILPAELKAIEELYIGFFNRIPDADGLSHWIDQYKAGETVKQIADRFYEIGVQHGNTTGYSNAMTNDDFIKIIYANVLSRTGDKAPNATEIGHWSQQLENNTASRGSIVTAILESVHTEYANDPQWGWVGKLLDNKVAVAHKVAVEWGLTYPTDDLSITQGMKIAGAVTDTDITAAINLVGVNAVFA